MENYFKSKSKSTLESPTSALPTPTSPTPTPIPPTLEPPTPTHTPTPTPPTLVEREDNDPDHLGPIINVVTSSRLDDLGDLPSDPGLRPRISIYNPNDQNVIRRPYLQRGPCQPNNYDFPQKQMGKLMRRFHSYWLIQHQGWLNYSIANDAAYCLPCYLFKNVVGDQGGGDTFVYEGFSNWSKPRAFEAHVGRVNSVHNLAVRKCKNLMKPNAHINISMDKQINKKFDDYRVRLNGTIVCIRYLLNQGLAFCGHDESDDSINQGNFLELLKLVVVFNEEMMRVSLNNAPHNNKLTAPEIQKYIVNACAIETVNAILKDLGDGLFSVLIDESRDISIKEKMAVVLRFVDKKRCVVERFVGTMHVLNTKAITLKSALDALFCKYGLNIMRLRGQGYDGSSNMSDDFNGLKALIMKENKSAFYVHCFIHQLQLTLVHVAKHHGGMFDLFSIVTCVVNLVSGSSLRQDIIRMKQGAKLIEKLDSGQISSGQGLNQQTGLKRAGDTRWNSHYYTLANLILMFSYVLEFIRQGTSDDKCQANSLFAFIQSFDFVLSMHLMKSVLAINNELSKLQRKDQNIVNAMTLVKVANDRLQAMRDTGWDSLLSCVALFCEEHHIVIPRMEDVWVASGRPRRNTEEWTTLHHYQVGLVNTCIDMQLQELNRRFTEVNTELLICMSCLNPSDSFSAFNIEKLIRLAHFYPNDFPEYDLGELQDQLGTYIWDVSTDDDFSKLNGVSNLAKKMVETGRNIDYPMVYLLISLSLIPLVATATVERAFLPCIS